MVPLETPTVVFTDGVLQGGYGVTGAGGVDVMAKISNHDRSDVHSVSDPAANVNGSDSSSNNNDNISTAAVASHQEDSRTKEEDGGDKAWLQLGIGQDTAKLRSGCSGNKDDRATAEVRDQGLLELRLVSSAAAAEEGLYHAPPPPPSYPRHEWMMRGASFFCHQMFRPPTSHHNPSPFSAFFSSSSSSSLSSSLPPWMPIMSPYNFQSAFQSSLGVNTKNMTRMDLGAGPSSDFRVVDPPRRSHSGIWFFLQASQTQAKEPFLPQVHKSYLRIKDGRIMVRLLIKYLMKKLHVDSESEIEIKCKGRQISPLLTMQHVRDTIWSSIDSSSSPSSLSSSSSSSSPSSPSFTLLRESSTDHVMILHYGRSA